MLLTIRYARAEVEEEEKERAKRQSLLDAVAVSNLATPPIKSKVKTRKSGSSGSKA